MKLMIASDIHGSAFYCRKMMERYEEEKPDKLLLLGDLLYHGPRNALPDRYEPKEVIEMLNGIKDKILCVRGNCDCDVDQMVMEFPIMADYGFLCVNDIPIYATHGHVINQNKPLIGLKGILLCGHTHVPAKEECDGFVYLNPGSVAIPKKESCHSYMVLEANTFFWKDVENGEVYMTYEYE